MHCQPHGGLHHRLSTLQLPWLTLARMLGDKLHQQPFEVPGAAGDHVPTGMQVCLCTCWPKDVLQLLRPFHGYEIIILSMHNQSLHVQGSDRCSSSCCCRISRVEASDLQALQRMNRCRFSDAGAASAADRRHVHQHALAAAFLQCLCRPAQPQMHGLRAYQYTEARQQLWLLLGKVCHK